MLIKKIMTLRGMISVLGTPSISVFRDVRNYKNSYRRILLGTTKPLFTNKSYCRRNFLFSQAVAIVVEIEDWSGKRGRFFGVPKKIVSFTIQFSEKRTAQKL
jgi:hypothetical protein